MDLITEREEKNRPKIKDDEENGIELRMKANVLCVME